MKPFAVGMLVVLLVGAGLVVRGSKEVVAQSGDAACSGFDSLNYLTLDVPAGTTMLVDGDTTIHADVVTVEGTLLTKQVVESGGQMRGGDLCLDVESLEVARGGVICTSEGDSAIPSTATDSSVSAADGMRGGDLTLDIHERDGKAITVPTLEISRGATLCTGPGGAGGPAVIALLGAPPEIECRSASTSSIPLLAEGGDGGAGGALTVVAPSLVAGAQAPQTVRLGGGGAGGFAIANANHPLTAVGGNGGRSSGTLSDSGLTLFPALSASNGGTGGAALAGPSSCLDKLSNIVAIVAAVQDCAMHATSCSTGLASWVQGCVIHVQDCVACDDFTVGCPGAPDTRVGANGHDGIPGHDGTDAWGAERVVPTITPIPLPPFFTFSVEFVCTGYGPATSGTSDSSINGQPGYDATARGGEGGQGMIAGGDGGDADATGGMGGTGGKGGRGGNGYHPSLGVCPNLDCAEGGHGGAGGDTGVPTAIGGPGGSVTNPLGPGFNGNGGNAVTHGTAGGFGGAGGPGGAMPGPSPHACRGGCGGAGGVTLAAGPDTAGGSPGTGGLVPGQPGTKQALGVPAGTRAPDGPGGVGC